MTETVLIFGASGNVGIAAVIGALRVKRNVIAIVRNQATAEKIFKYVGTREGITTVEADINSEESIKGVIDQVRAGKLPSFQHVWASPGYAYAGGSIVEVGLSGFHESMAANVDTYIIAYIATIPYLLEQGYAGSSWMMCTGTQGELGLWAAPAVTQGALFSFAISAARELEDTPVRFNEVLLGYRVQQEVSPGVTTFQGIVPMTTSIDFAPLYEQLIDRKDIKGSRVRVDSPKDVADLKFEKRF
ncbi:short-chain dehydrogenase [Colletotrichum musicola]|uniref:Short-chain dehydrogenase n=1 Tax=Colletotrichum musicola TaxID=2175873 RepID=A0A8H6J5R4_9PEZI|nr:short-chain dehydrogenase [Colletotrichum musicola]